MATKTLQSGARAGVNWTYTNTAAGVGDVSVNNGSSFTASLASGTGAGAADLLYVAQLTINASANNDLDLAGALQDVFGATLTFVRIKGVFMVPDATNTASGFKVGAAASNQFFGFFNSATDAEKVDKTGCFFKFRSDATGWTVTSGTGDLLRVTNLDGVNQLILNVAIIGCSA